MFYGAEIFNNQSTNLNWNLSKITTSNQVTKWRESSNINDEKLENIVPESARQLLLNSPQTDPKRKP